MNARKIVQALSLSLAALTLAPGCALMSAYQASQLQKTGLPAKAIVLSISDTGETINDDPVADLELEVHPETGPVFKAKTEAIIGRLDVPQFQPGCTIPVRYDANDHSRVGVDVYK